MEYLEINVRQEVEPLVQITPEPCTKNGKCEHYQDCAENRKACALFVNYCSNGLVKEERIKIFKTGKKLDMRTPSERLYRDLFPGYNKEETI